MSDARRRAMTEFSGDLQRLRRLAGSPSLNQLVELAGDLNPPLHRSTISDKLNAKSLPEWDFVASFVTACQRHAEKSGVPLPGDDVDLARWDALHLRMLRRVDESREDERLIRAAETEIRRRGTRAPAPTAPAGSSVVPRQLPAALRTFTGRAAELTALTKLVDSADGDTAFVATIDGMGGIGKSALAVCWAQRHADRFPDGQLHVNLRGFGPGGPPMTPREALRGFLEALGVPPHRIPSGTDDAAALYRSLLAGRRVLVLLDNARDCEQVRPLLPGTPGCVVLVTSRDRLTGLVTTDATLPLSLNVIDVDDARDLLARRLGEERMSADPSAVRTIVARCAGLPLALSIVAARAAARPALRMADLAEDLARDGLDGFRADETPGGDMRAVFSWSYRQLTPDAARVFRGFGLHPASDLSVEGAASAAGLPVGRARAVLADLAQAHLLDERRPGRFGCHDLIRAYAAELGRTEDTDADRRATVRRMLDHYLGSAHAADRRLEPGRDPITLPEPADGVVIEAFEDAERATAWLTEHHPAVIAAATLAAETGFDGHAWRLAWTLTPFLDRQADWPMWAATHATALAAALRLSDRPAIAYAHRILGRACIRLGRLDDAHAHMSQALETYVELGDDKGTANAHEGLSLICEMQDRYGEALEHSQRALAILQAAGRTEVVGRLMNSVGWCHGLLGDHALARAYCEKALAHSQGLGDRSGEAETLDSLGHLHHQTGNHGEAVVCLRNALDIHRELGYRFPEGGTLDLLGDALQALGDLDGAREHWRAALVVLDEMRDPRAGELRSKLSRPADPRST